jgi:hypothetical protein
MKSVIGQASKIIFLDIIGEILYFPLWWYSAGLKRIWLYVFDSIKRTSLNLAVPLMVKSMFKPMFGQADRQGRAISFFMRLVLLLSRLVVFIVLTILDLALLIFWLILPVIVMWGLKENYSSLWRP